MQLPDCNCDRLLTGVFDDNDHNSNGISTPKEKQADYVPGQEDSQDQLPLRIATDFHQAILINMPGIFTEMQPRPPRI